MTADVCKRRVSRGRNQDRTNCEPIQSICKIYRVRSTYQNNNHEPYIKPADVRMQPFKKWKCQFCIVVIGSARKINQKDPDQRSCPDLQHKFIFCCESE